MPAVRDTTPALEPDAQPLCPHCDYNLTGLPEPRCPECGIEFRWEAVLHRTANPPAIAFERLKRWHKVPGFLLTWLTVLFAPWKFASEAVRRISPLHAFVFAVICFATTPLGDSGGATVATVVAWTATAIIYVLL